MNWDINRLLKIKPLVKAVLHLLPHGSKWRRVLATRMVKIRFSCDQIASVRNMLRLQFLEEACRRDVVVLGSSHMAYGFDPRWCRDKASNLALRSCDLRTIYYLAKYVSFINPAAKIVVGLDFWMHSMQTEYSSDFPACMVLDELRIVPLRNRFLSEFYQKYSKENAKPISERYSFFNGYWSGLEYFNVAVKERVAQHLRFMRFSKSELAWLRRLVDLFIENKNHLAFVFPPVRKDYLECIGEGPGKLFDDYRSICRGYEILDFSEDVGFSDDDFGDADHLSAKGAKKFTGMIMDRIR